MNHRQKIFLFLYTGASAAIVLRLDKYIIGMTEMPCRRGAILLVNLE